MLSFANILHSKQFTFHIGVDGIPITVHSGAIAALSAPLERLVNGPFKEAQENHARFPDIEVEDFEKICAVAYGAELPVPETRLLPSSEVNIKEDIWPLSCRILGPESYEVPVRENKLTAQFLLATIGDLNVLPNIPARKNSTPLYENTVADYHSCKLLELPDEDDIADESKDNEKTTTRIGSFWNQDVSGALLGYARIYTFAEEYLITKLRKDAETGLRNFLARLDVYRPTRPSIIELLQYIYNDEYVPNRDDGEVMHPLREMVVHFVALHLPAFRDYPPHRDLLRRGGDYAVDLQDVVGEWLL